MIRQAMQRAIGGEDLSMEEAMGAMDEIMSGEATAAQIGAYLVALRMKGESIDEITASARIMREKAEKIRPAGDVMDIVGTGGDCANTFNISTLSALIAAAAGVRVAKHGNRSVSSKCGAADLLEALGVRIDLAPEQVAEVLQKAGICFMFAQTFHRSMKYAAAPRRELGVRTIFNILGPLVNPASANLQLLGVYDEALCEPLARVLQNLGVKRAMTVYGRVGLDEISLCGETAVCELRDGHLLKYLLSPEDFGMTPCTLEELRGGDAGENAAIVRRLLAGEKGPKRDVAVINAAAALYLAGLGASLRECVSTAEEMLDSGRARQKLEELIGVSNSFPPAA